MNYSEDSGQLCLKHWSCVFFIIQNISPLWNGYYLNSAVWRGIILTPTWKNRIENEAITENCPAPSFHCFHGELRRVVSMQSSSR